jgi:hypothetical protein
MSPTRDEDRMRIAFRVELEKPSYADAEEIRKYLLEAMAQYDQDAEVTHLGEVNRRVPRDSDRSEAHR